MDSAWSKDDALEKAARAKATSPTQWYVADNLADHTRFFVIQVCPLPFMQALCLLPGACSTLYHHVLSMQAFCLVLCARMIGNLTLAEASPLASCCVVLHCIRAVSWYNVRH